MQKNVLRVIVGPTAIGKTALSIALAKRWDAEIVSADAIQVYTHLDIGSAKPTMEERQGVAHHMLSVVEAGCSDYSVAAYREQAMECIDNIVSRGKIPLVVGGTGLYIDALTRPMDFTQPADPAVRNALLQQEALQKGSLHAKLALLDKAAATRIHPNDIKRTVRALEVHALTGKPISEHIHASRQLPAPYDSRILGLNTDRETLYRRIEARVREMMRQGLLEEVRALKAAGLDAVSRSMQGLGYKQLMAHICGECTLDEAVDAIIRETRHFAKRQLTWFRRDARVFWLDTAQYADLHALADAAEGYFMQPAKPL